MKKLTKVIGMMCMAALVAFTASSCKKTEDEGSEFQIRLAQLQGFQTAERAYIDVMSQSELRWNDGDQIMVYNLDADYTKSIARVFTAQAGAEGQTVAYFRGRSVGAKKSIGYFYFYPASKASGSLQEDNRETFTVAATQTYNPDFLADPTALVMACTVDAVNANFNMEHIFGMLHVGVRSDNAETHHVTSIVIEDKTFHLSGTMSLKLPEVNSATLSGLIDEIGGANYETDLAAYLQQLGYESNGDGYTMTLNCCTPENPEGIEVNNNGNTHFLISLRPGALYKGYRVTVNYDNGLSKFVELNGTAPEKVIKPGWINNEFIQL